MNAATADHISALAHDVVAARALPTELQLVLNDESRREEVAAKVRLLMFRAVELGLEPLTGLAGLRLRSDGSVHVDTGHLAALLRRPDGRYTFRFVLRGPARVVLEFLEHQGDPAGFDRWQVRCLVCGRSEERATADAPTMCNVAGPHAGTRENAWSTKIPAGLAWLGDVDTSLERAQREGAEVTSEVWRKHPEGCLVARALREGARRFAPDVCPLGSGSRDDEETSEAARALEEAEKPARQPRSSDESVGLGRVEAEIKARSITRGEPIINDRVEHGRDDVRRARWADESWIAYRYSHRASQAAGGEDRWKALDTWPALVTDGAPTARELVAEARHLGCPACSGTGSTHDHAVGISQPASPVIRGPTTGETKPTEGSVPEAAPHNGEGPHPTPPHAPDSVSGAPSTAGAAPPTAAGEMHGNGRLDEGRGDRDRGGAGGGDEGVPEGKEGGVLRPLQRHPAVRGEGEGTRADRGRGEGDRGEVSEPPGTETASVPGAPPAHKHRCMRCSEEFDCRSPGACAAGYDVVPKIVVAGPNGPEIVDHCPRADAGPDDQEEEPEPEPVDLEDRLDAALALTETTEEWKGPTLTEVLASKGFKARNSARQVTGQEHDILDASGTVVLERVTVSEVWSWVRAIDDEPTHEHDPETVEHGDEQAARNGCSCERCEAKRALTQPTPEQVNVVSNVAAGVEAARDGDVEGTAERRSATQRRELAARWGKCPTKRAKEPRGLCAVCGLDVEGGDRYREGLPVPAAGHVVKRRSNKPTGVAHVGCVDDLAAGRDPTHGLAACPIATPDEGAPAAPEGATP